MLCDFNTNDCYSLSTTNKSNHQMQSRVLEMAIGVHYKGTKFRCRCAVRAIRQAADSRPNPKQLTSCYMGRQANGWRCRRAHFISLHTMSMCEMKAYVSQHGRCRKSSSAYNSVECHDGVSSIYIVVQTHTDVSADAVFLFSIICEHRRNCTAAGIFLPLLFRAMDDSTCRTDQCDTGKSIV